MNLKKTSPYLLYPKSGTHWNYYSAYLFCMQFIQKIEGMMNEKLTPIPCEKIEVKRIPQGSDADLADLANVMFTKSFYGEYPYPLVQTTSTQGEFYRPKMLFIGGSYLWGLFHYMDKHQVYSQRIFYYYYNNRVTYPQISSAIVDKQKESLQKEILSQDQ